MEQLGPFHIFFTLSCAEMRWPSVISEVFRTIGNGKIKIHYDDNWDGTAETITVTQVNEHGEQEEMNGEYCLKLSSYQKWYFQQKKISMTDFLKDHFVLITRIFDKRVKDFITEVMKKKGIVNYAYRVEFQMRGLPHIHGVAWLDPEQIKDCIDNNGLFREDKDGEEHIINLIDKWISCELEFGHVDQKERIKSLNDEIINCERDLKALQYDIDIINTNIDNLKQEKANLTEKDAKLKKNKLYTKQLKALEKQLKDLINEKKAKVKEYMTVENEIKSNKIEEKGKRELNQLVREVNSHHCTGSCRKYDKNKCRYDFPRFFSAKTIIANPFSNDVTEEEKKIHQKILEKRNLILKLVKDGYKKLDENDMQFDKDPRKFLEEICGLNTNDHSFFSEDPDNIILKIDKPHDILEIYNTAISISEKGRIVVLKRKISERNINNYNPLFHSVWQANTDIQLALDQHAVISYISDYMTKSDKGLTRDLTAALNEKKNASQFEQLNHLKRTYFYSRQTCVSEAAYRLLPSLDLKRSNIKTLFLCSGFPENRRTFLRAIPEDENQDEGIEIEGREGRFQQPTSRIDFYSARPKDSTSKYSVGRIENMCYAEFCMKYDKVAEKNIPPKWTFEEYENKEGEVVHGIGHEANPKKAKEFPLKGLPQYFFFTYEGKRIYMRLRANPYILRIYSGKRKDNIEETYSELLLFTAWTDERKTFYNDDTDFREIIQQMFRKEDEQDSIEIEDEKLKDKLRGIKRKGLEVERNRKKIYPHSDRIAELRALLEEGDFHSSNLGDGLDPAVEQQDAEDNECQEGFPDMDDEILQETSTSKQKGKGRMKEEKCVYKIPDVEEETIMKRNVRSLSYEQRVVFDKFIDFAKRVMCAIRYSGNIDTTPPRLIVHGGGGVGKSYLIKLISQWVHKILSSWGDIVQYPKLIRLAFTGAASYLIGKS